jgi:hypothetical protein
MNRSFFRPPRTCRPRLLLLGVLLASLVHGLPSFAASLTPTAPRTVVSIEGDRFLINGRPTYEGRLWRGKKIEGLLMNSRIVQGVFDDLNPETVSRWAYPDTGKWDAERNNREFLAAMPVWRAHGLLAFTINFQGGSPEGYSRTQPWSNPGFAADGTPLPAYLERMARIISSDNPPHRLGPLEYSPP